MYGEPDVAPAGVIRLRDLLGLSLEELVELVEAEEARGTCCAAAGTQTRTTTSACRSSMPRTPLVERQLELVRARRAALGQFAAELEEKLERIRTLREELETKLAGFAPSVG